MNKEQGNKYRAQSWLGVWVLADWTDCISSQVEPLWGHDSWLSCVW